MIKELNLNYPWVRRRVVGLQRAAFHIERGLYPDIDIPPLRVDMATLLDGEQVYLGFQKRFRTIGMVSYRYEGPTVEICRLMVARPHWRQGIGRRLIEAVEARERSAKSYRVVAAQANTQALAFYAKAGYRPAGRFEGVPGVILERMEKKGPRWTGP